MVGGGSRRDDGPLKIGSSNVFAALETLKKKKKSDKDKNKGSSKNQAKAPEPPQVFWAPTPLKVKSWADVDDDDDDYYATTAPPQSVWGSSDAQQNKESSAVAEEKKFQWDPEDEHYIRRNWERRGSTRLADIFNEARENRDRKPDWIGEGVWHELWKYWDSDEFKGRSQKNKKNRASDCGGLGFPLHTGGSISINDHATRLTKKLNRAPTLDELFRHTHQKKKDGNQWVNKKAETSHNNFIQKWQEVESSQSSTGEDGAESSQQQPQPSMMHVWKDTVGVNKGRIYGLGSQACLLTGSSSSSRTSSRVSEEWIQERERIYNMFQTVSSRNEELATRNEELANQNSQLASQNNELSARISRTEEFMHLMMEKMQVNPSTVSAPFPAATSANDGDCDNVDDDDDDDDDHEEDL